jgi:NTP pyrophosphatase (non-canonical NTP hydrolase)
MKSKENITLEEVQKQVDQWIQNCGVRYFNELTNLALLTEEVGEVARIMARQFGEQNSKPGEKNKELADELADVLFVLVCIANQTGINLSEAFLNNLNKKYQRDKTRHKNNKKLNR